MLIGISTGLKHDTPQEWAQKMVELQCKSVVFPVDYTAPDSLIADYASEAQKNGLVIAEVGIWRNPFGQDLEKRKQDREFCKGQLQLADQIKARCCVNVAGAMSGSRWDGGCRENFTKEAFDQIVRFSQDLIDSVKPKHTKFCLETMPWMLPTGPKEYKQLAEAIDREQFGVHMDLVNMINCPQRYFFIDEFMEECFDLLGEEIVSCHLKDIKLKEQYTFQLEEVACGQGSLPIEKYITLVDQYHLNTPMIVEHLSSDEEYMESLQYLKNRLGKFGLL